ncbi:MAG: LLM class flavin-dependent oxidoreductase [Polyangiales bacterium]
MTTRTGLLPFWKNYDRKLYLKAAIVADELGYDSFWIPEAWGYEVFSLLTEIAVHTTRIKLGTGIVNCFSRSPGLLATNAATVDQINEGRLILGLGTSGQRVIEGFHAREFKKPLTRLRDVIRVVKTLLSGFGYADECKRIDELYRDKKTRAQATAAVSDEMIEALSIAGDPKYCIAELRRRRQYGIDLPILNLPTNLPWEMVELFIRTMAPSG